MVVTVMVGNDGQVDRTQMNNLVNPIVEGHLRHSKNYSLIRECKIGRSMSELCGGSILNFLTEHKSVCSKTMDPKNTAL